MPHGCRGRLFNLLAVIMVGLSLVSVGWVAVIAAQPYGRFNPFPPPTQVGVVTLVSASPPVMVSPPVTPDMPSPTPTMEATPEPTATTLPTITPSPVVTLSPVVTPTLTATVLPTVMPSPTVTATRLALTYTASITYQVHPVQVCDWMGVGGSVTDLQGRAVITGYVHVWGLDNANQIVAVGSSPNYGPSGWEVRLARAQIVGSWSVQLVASPEVQTPLSMAFTISMPGDCKRNLALVRFQQNR